MRRATKRKIKEVENEKKNKGDEYEKNKKEVEEKKPFILNWE